MMKENLTEIIQNSIRKNWEITALADYKGEGLKYSQVAEQRRKPLKKSNFKITK